MGCLLVRWPCMIAVSMAASNNVLFQDAAGLAAFPTPSPPQNDGL